MKVAVVQSGVEPCAVAQNLARLDAQLAALARQGVELTLETVPAALARRHGVPVLLSSIGGPLVSRGSPALPFGLRTVRAGRSGIYLPAGRVASG